MRKLTEYNYLNKGKVDHSHRLIFLCFGITDIIISG